MKKYIIMITITFVLVLVILFYNPNNKYLGVYKDTFTIEYNIDEGNQSKWSYSMSNSLIELAKEGNNGTNNYFWQFKPIKDGTTTLKFIYKESIDDLYTYEIIYDLTIKGNKIIWTNGEAKGLIDYPNPY